MVKRSPRLLRHVLVALLYASGIGFGIGFATASVVWGLVGAVALWPAFTAAIRERDD